MEDSKFNNIINKLDYCSFPNFEVYLFTETCVDVKLTTISWANEISWSFGSCNSSQPYFDDNVHTERCCLLPGEHALKCKDSYGDGWHGGFIEIKGAKYCETFDSGSQMVEQVTCKIFL